MTPVNDPPTVTGVAASTAVEGDTSTLTATLEDVDEATLDVAVAWGDGRTDTYPGVGWEGGSSATVEDGEALEAGRRRQAQIETDEAEALRLMIRCGQGGGQLQGVCRA